MTQLKVAGIFVLTKHSGSLVKGGGHTFSGMTEEILSYQVEEIL